MGLRLGHGQVLDEQDLGSVDKAQVLHLPPQAVRLLGVGLKPGSGRGGEPQGHPQDRPGHRLGEHPDSRLLGRPGQGLKQLPLHQEQQAHRVPGRQVPGQDQTVVVGERGVDEHQAAAGLPHPPPGLGGGAGGVHLGKHSRRQHGGQMLRGCRGAGDQKDSASSHSFPLLSVRKTKKRSPKARKTRSPATVDVASFF